MTQYCKKKHILLTKLKLQLLIIIKKFFFLLKQKQNPKGLHFCLNHHGTPVLSH